uniref:UDP-glycosyltransferase 79B6-like n=1 Tax=Rhizophora mucronata TaxID=61149 RepID=A0A2P2IR71_RHIMU
MRSRRTQHQALWRLKLFSLGHAFGQRPCKDAYEDERVHRRPFRHQEGGHPRGELPGERNEWGWGSG